MNTFRYNNLKHENTVILLLQYLSKSLYKSCDLPYSSSLVMHVR
jgi:hypothetical protein